MLNFVSDFVNEKMANLAMSRVRPDSVFPLGVTESSGVTHTSSHWVFKKSRGRPSTYG